MPLFMSDDELRLLGGDAAAVAERADAVIRDLRRQLDTVRAELDAREIAAEQTAAFLEQRYADLADERDRLLSSNAALTADAERRGADIAAAATEKHQLHLAIIAKDREIERLSAEMLELQKAKRRALELIEHRDTELKEKNAMIQSYLDKITNLTDGIASKDTKVHEVELELTKSRAMCSRLSQEKELLEKQNVWLDEELNTKIKSLAELRRSNIDEEANLAARISDLERELTESSASLKRSKERSTELEQRISLYEKELCSAKESAAGNEQRLKNELSTVSKLADLYKESSEEWSRKAGELEGVIKALETHLSQVEAEYQEKLEKEISNRKELEEEVSGLKQKLEKCEAELESSRKAKEFNLLRLTTFPTELGYLSDSGTKQLLLPGIGENAADDIDKAIVPKLPTGISGTAVAACLIRDGWSLAKMYEKYQEAADAMRHERWGRKHAETVLERVLHEIEEKAELILDERAEHERMIEAYSLMDQKLQQALLEHETFENTIRNLKAELRQSERHSEILQKEIEDLEKQVSVLLKECQDIQLRCGTTIVKYDDKSSDVMNADIVTKASSEYVAYKDINELVSQNVQLRNQVVVLSSDIERKEAEIREVLQVELQKVMQEASSKTEAVLKRSEEQAAMLESLHSSVAMYRRLYEEERKLRATNSTSSPILPGRMNNLSTLVDDSVDVTKKAYDKLAERARTLEEELSSLRSDVVTLRLERDKLALEAGFATERLKTALVDLDHQRKEGNAVSLRNIELSQLLVDYQKRVREGADSLQVYEENSRKLSMEVSILRHEKEILLNSEKKALDEVRDLTERVHRLQSTLDTIRSTEEVRENARAMERRHQEQHIVRLEKDWAEVKKELQDERDRARMLTLDREKAVEASIAAMEQMKQEIADAWRAVASAESRVAVAEAKCSELEGKTARNKGLKDGGSGVTTETHVDLLHEKEEMEKLREEAHANKTYMLQYKEIAHTNEIALKNIEAVYQEYKAESEASKKSLEDELLVLQNKLSEAEKKFLLKSEEYSAALESKEKEVFCSLTENASLRDDIAQKMSKIAELECNMAAQKEEIDLVKKRYQTMKENYDRQVIIQSETIQELASTSKQLSTLQCDLAKLREISDALKTENDSLRSLLELEKSELQKQQDEAERKCNELNEQNKILHNQLEVLHVRLASKELDSAGRLFQNSDSKIETDLHDVISYLRRSKEIAETEISLLKQEKLRLQSELVVATKASEEAKSLLRAQAEKARATLLREEEFKSLQLQIKDVNLLRESNIHLSGENRHNFEESQKYRAEAGKAKGEVERLSDMLLGKQLEIDVCKREIEMQKVDIENLNKQITEMSAENSKRVDPTEHEQMKDELHRIQVLLSEKEVELERSKISVSEKQDSILKLEETLSRCQASLEERETKLNDVLQVEANLRSETDRQKRSMLTIKKKIEILSREKEELGREVTSLKITSETLLREKVELGKENQELSKQIEEFKSLGRKTSVEASSEQSTYEKDARLQTLEKTLEKERAERAREKDKRVKAERTVFDLVQNVQKEKKKVEEELEKLKQATAAVLETGIAAAQLPSESALDEQALNFFSTVENFEETASFILNGGLGNQSLAPETSSVEPTTAGQAAAQAKPNVAQTQGATERRATLLPSNSEGRRTVRRLVRPSLARIEETPVEMDGSGRDEVKGSHSHEPDGSAAGVSLSRPQTSARKRLVSTLHTRQEAGMDDAGAAAVAPLSKKPKEDVQESEVVAPLPKNPKDHLLQGCDSKAVISTSESAMIASGHADEHIEVQLSAEEMESDQTPLLPTEDTSEAARDEDVNNREDIDEHPDAPADRKMEDVIHLDSDTLPEELPEKSPQAMSPMDEGQKSDDVRDGGDDEEREEGEVVPDESEQQQEDTAAVESHREPTPTDGVDAFEELDVSEVAASPEGPTEKSDFDISEDVGEGITSADQGAGDTGSLIMPGGPGGSPSRVKHASVVPDVATSSAPGSSGLDQQVTVSSSEAEEPRRGTILITERAKRNAMLRQQAMLTSQQAPSAPATSPAQTPSRGRGRPATSSFRRDGTRGRGRARGA